MKSIFIVVGLLMSLSAPAQKVVIGNPAVTCWYEGIPNDMEVCVEGLLCEHLVLSTDNGSIRKSGSPCAYVLEPDSSGMATIKVVNQSSGRTVQTLRIPIKEVPEPIAVLQQQAGGYISRRRLADQQGLFFVIPDVKADVRIVTKTFTISVFRDGKCIQSGNNEGMLFSRETKSLINSAQKGDRLVFSGMSYQLYHRKGLVRPAEFIVTD